MSLDLACSFFRSWGPSLVAGRFLHAAAKGGFCVMFFFRNSYLSLDSSGWHSRILRMLILLADILWTWCANMMLTEIRACSLTYLSGSGAALCCFLVSRINLANYSVLSRFILPRMVDMIVHLRGRVRWRRKSMHLYESPPSLDIPSLELCILVAPWVRLVVLWFWRLYKTNGL